MSYDTKLAHFDLEALRELNNCPTENDFKYVTKVKILELRKQKEKLNKQLDSRIEQSDSSDDEDTDDDECGSQMSDGSDTQVQTLQAFEKSATLKNKSSSTLSKTKSSIAQGSSEVFHKSTKKSSKNSSGNTKSLSPTRKIRKKRNETTATGNKLSNILLKGDSMTGECGEGDNSGEMLYFFIHFHQYL